jgi:hypothetical protein
MVCGALLTVPCANNTTTVKAATNPEVALDKMAFTISAATPLPPIVIPFDAQNQTGYDWQKLKDLKPYAAEYDVPNGRLFLAVSYLREGIARMTGQELPVENSQDFSRGIVLTTLQFAPPEIQNDAQVKAALKNSGEDAYNNQEAFYIRADAKRVLIVANTLDGLAHGAVELLESVGYEQLGMGPNWTYVPDFKNQPLQFKAMERAGRPAFYIRDLSATSAQQFGFGTLFEKTLPDAADEPVDVSYARWRTGARFAGRSMPPFPGHQWQKYHRAVADKMWDLKTTEGFLTPKTTFGPDAQRPPAAPENEDNIWIDSETKITYHGGANEHVRVFISDGKVWKEYDMMSASGGAKLDISVPFVREIILDALKKEAQKFFAAPPSTLQGKILNFGTEQEDGVKPADWMRHPNWYPEYLKQEKIEFGKPYVLNGFKGLGQPNEIWDATAKTDHVFAFNNWLLREFDKWIDALPTAEQTVNGRSKKEFVRASFYSYSDHDVPPNFNLDPRIRVMIAGYPYHRGGGKWHAFSSVTDMAQAFKKLLPREPSSDYWILSFSLSKDQDTGHLRGSALPSSMSRRMTDLYASGLRAVSAETDFNQGRQGLEYYIYSKLLWNPERSLEEVNALRDRWMQRAYGAGWREMKEYYEFFAPENFAVSTPTMWAKAIRFIVAADEKIDDNSDAQKRLDDLKQYWYYYYLMDTKQDTRDSAALKEFLWKGQMSYMTAMHAVCTRVFGNIKVREIVGAELQRGPAHFTHEETAVWWKKILDHWPLIPVVSFSETTLADGKKVRDVDLNDLVAVREFRTNTPDAAFFYNSGDQDNASVLTRAKVGDEIGFKLYWPYTPNHQLFGQKSLKYDISFWNPHIKDWETIADMATTSQVSQTVNDKAGKPQQVVTVRRKVGKAGTYRLTLGYAGFLSSLTTLNYDVATGVYGDAKGLSQGFTFHAIQGGLTQSPTYIYIPKGVKSFDLEVWGPNEPKSLKFFKGLPTQNATPTREVALVKQGTQTIALEEGEDGTVAVLESSGFRFPFLHSVPMLWAKSPQQLLVPRAVAQADGLTILQ